LRPSVIVLALVAVSVAGCSSDTSRFENPFSNPFASKPQAASGEVTGSIYSAPPGGIETRPLPPPGQGSSPVYGGGVSGGGRGMAPYQPSYAPAQQQDITGSVVNRPAPPPAPVAPSAALAPATPPRSVASQAAPGTHTVAPGETLIGISRRYNVQLKDLAKANSIEPYAQVKMGDRLVIPGRAAATPAKPQTVAAKPQTDAAKPAAAAPAKTAPVQAQAQPPKLPAPAPTQKVATAEPQHTARALNPTPDVSEEAVKASAGAPSFRWPVRGRIIAGFGPKSNGQQNDGINLSVPEGTPIKAAEDGVVAYAGNELKGYGNLVLIRHPNGFVTAYAHASEVLVKRGDAIKRGQTIAKAGQTGTVSSPQVHFEIRKGSSPVDPTQYLNGA
jgi:murein DD-endopeptidase MepM/ murein hydrolase activator NlpD